MRLEALLLCSTTFVCLSFGQRPKEESTAADIPYSVFTQRLKSVSSERGGQPTDCTASFAAFGSLDDCARTQFRDHKPFFLGYPNRSSAIVPFAYGLAGDSVGNVFSISYHGRGFAPVSLNRHMRLMDENHTRVVECIKPVRLETTPQGLMTCVPPVNQKQSKVVARRKPVETTICAILANPSAFNNKLVRVRGYFVGNFENSTLNDNRCRGSLWLGYGGGGEPPGLVASVSITGNMLGSEDSKGRRILPIPVSLIRDSKLERFETLVRAHTERGVPLIGALVQRVTATFIGRVDAVSTQVHEFLKQQSSGNWTLGFGQMGGYAAQLILQSVADDATLQ